MSAYPLALVDRSGAITTGGAAQDAAAANSGRQYLLIQNIDAAEALWVNLGATAAVATAGSITLAAGASLVFESGPCATGRVSVVAATTGHKFTVKEG